MRGGGLWKMSFPEEKGCVCLHVCVCVCMYVCVRLCASSAQMARQTSEAQYLCSPAPSHNEEWSWPTCSWFESMVVYPGPGPGPSTDVDPAG